MESIYRKSVFNSRLMIRHFFLLPVRRRVDRYAEINQSHATDDKGELEEAYATANSTILFRYQLLAAFLLSAHRVMFYNSS